MNKTYKLQDRVVNHDRPLQRVQHLWIHHYMSFAVVYFSVLPIRT